MTAARTESAYTGPTDDGGVPCSDTHHAVMYLPDGQPYEVPNYRCAACGEPDGFHHRRASCGTILPDGNAQRIQWHRDNPQ